MYKMPVNLRRTILQLQNLLGALPRSYSLITGAPRSGTSAVCYWLNSQRDACGFYESRVTIAAFRAYQEVCRFRKLAEAKESHVRQLRRWMMSYYRGKRWIWGRVLIDKEPLEPIAFPDLSYREYLRFIRDAFPDVRLVFVTRNAVNTVWSMLHREWGQSLSTGALKTLSLEESCAIWQDCSEIVQEFRGFENVYVCEYETLVADPVAESHRICEFLKIRLTRPFEPRPAKSVGFTNEELQSIEDLVRERQTLPVKSGQMSELHSLQQADGVAD